MVNRVAMDSILSSVLSIFSHNPIFVLGIIAYIAFSIIKVRIQKSLMSMIIMKARGARLGRDMEREYGISIEKKPVEPSTEDLLYDDDFIEKSSKIDRLKISILRLLLRKRVEDCFL